MRGVDSEGVWTVRGSGQLGVWTVRGVDSEGCGQ